MGYAVHYRDASGAAKLEDTESLDVALERVEQLRNEDGATDVRVFREVPVEVRTYYKVVAADEGGSSRSEPPPGAMPLAPQPVAARAAVTHEPPAAEDRADEQLDDPIGDNARRSSLFNRG